MSRAWIFGAPLLAVLLLALLWSFPGATAAQTASGDLPANASAKSYGDGWTCDRGYRSDHGDCEAIDVPANALATQTSYGRGWECRRGFREVNGACNAIEIPANAYLNAASTRWECERGYREVNDRCIVIEVPANGYLSDSDFGPGWKCERGFRASDDTCTAVVLPENAHIDYSGSDWECDQPFVKQADGCVLR